MVIWRNVKQPGIVSISTNQFHPYDMDFDELMEVMHEAPPLAIAMRIMARIDYSKALLNFFMKHVEEMAKSPEAEDMPPEMIEMIIQQSNIANASMNAVLQATCQMEAVRHILSGGVSFDDIPDDAELLYLEVVHSNTFRTLYDFHNGSCYVSLAEEHTRTAGVLHQLYLEGVDCQISEYDVENAEHHQTLIWHTGPDRLNYIDESPMVDSIMMRGDDDDDDDFFDDDEENDDDESGWPGFLWGNQPLN